MMIKESDIAVLFDLDGVLLDSEGTYTDIWRSIDERYPTGRDNFAVAIKGCTLDKILAENFAPRQIDEVRDLLHRLESKMVYRLFDGAMPLLSRLRERGVAVALVTSSDNVKMAHLFSQMPDLKECFDVIIDANSISRSKPDPQGYLLAAKRLRRDPRLCAVVEDSRQGVEAGRRAGSFVVGVSSTLPKSEIEPFCDQVVSDVADIDPDVLIQTLIQR